MSTWNIFIWFGVTAIILAATGAVAALCANDHWAACSVKYRQRRTIAVSFTVSAVVVMTAFIIGLWITLQRPPLKTMGETRLWYSFFALISGLFTYLRWRYKWILSYSTVLAAVFIIINIAKPQIHDQSLMPFDGLIKKHAAELGWDWRMLAAVVYQESKFSINSQSHRGAQGLMQVMPQTGRKYGIDDLVNPENNLTAGTAHLKRLQRMLAGKGLSQDELVKFTLASYNAGEGRIMDCRNLAAAQGLDNGVWDNIVKVIPMMREDSILEDESVKLGKFQGHETIAYVDNIMEIYNAICTICPR